MSAVPTSTPADRTTSSVPAQRPLLSVESLAVRFDTDHGSFPAVHDATFELARGETLGVVGESGSGKTVTMMAIAGLLPSTATVETGTIRLDGRDLVPGNELSYRGMRGARIGFVFQNAMNALNPVLRIGDQIAESIRRHQPDIGRREAIDSAVQLLADAGIPDPKRRSRQYPHHFSGGMRQRAMIAIAIANRPDLIIADEPTTALDVTIQAQILSLLDSVRAASDAAMILITHDLAVLADVADRVMVMYAGRTVESASTRDIFKSPQHPYTAGLLATIPRIGAGKADLAAIPGQPPDPRNLPSGCPFAPRCDRREHICGTDVPAAVHDRGRLVACHVPLPRRRD